MRHVLSQSGAPKYVKKTAPAASRFVTKVPRALRGVPLGHPAREHCPVFQSGPYLGMCQVGGAQS